MSLFRNSIDIARKVDHVRSDARCTYVTNLSMIHCMLESCLRIGCHSKQPTHESSDKRWVRQNSHTSTLLQNSTRMMDGLEQRARQMW